MACDHRDDDAVRAVFGRIAADHGRLDVLVNNAFAIPDELTAMLPFWEVPISNWDDMMDVGTRSAYVAAVLAAPGMIDQGDGLIANISSSGATEYAWHVAYGVGKCALDRMTADCSRELGDTGVSMVSVWPGFVRTERIDVAVDSGVELPPSLDLSAAESPRFTGRAVTALAIDAGPIPLFRSGSLGPRYGRCLRLHRHRRPPPCRPPPRPHRLAAVMTAVEPFAIEVPDEVLDDLHRRLDATRWFDPLPGAGWNEGTDLDYLKELCRYWRHEYDWRTVEAELNRFPQYTTVIDNQNLHFIHARSRNPDAMALVIHHGWPGSITEFAKVIEPLREHFHVVCPSLPVTASPDLPLSRAGRPGGWPRPRWS